MHVLMLHRHFPGHYPHLAPALAKEPGARVVFLTRDAEGRLPGVEKRVYVPHRVVDPRTHPYLQPLESAVLDGQAALRACLSLKADGFVPDVVCFHAGFGPALYVREAFPDAPLLGCFEWYYHARGGDAAFLEPDGLDPDTACRVRTRNAAVLLDLAEADRGTCPTAFQRAQFPEPLRQKLTLLHDGIDTGFYRPAPGMPLVLPGLDLSGAAEIVTYATRGLEPYRGFPQFLHAAARILRERPQAHVVVAGTDATFYGRRRPDGRTWKQALLAELAELDHRRLHFVGNLAPPHYRRLLQASTVHVYLTVPFVLSWSLLEAMACGCLVVASDTEPVREVIADGRNGLLTGFFDADRLAERITAALAQHDALAGLRQAARTTIRERFALADLLPHHLALVHAVAAGGQRAQTDHEPTIHKKDAALMASSADMPASDRHHTFQYSR